MTPLAAMEYANNILRRPKNRFREAFHEQCSITSSYSAAHCAVEYGLA